MNPEKNAIGFKEEVLFSGGYGVGNTLYVSGQQGPDSGGSFDGLDVAEQTMNAIASIKAVLGDAGFALSDVVSMTVYLTELDDVPKMNAVYKKLIPNPKPARMAMQVAGLIGGAKVEIAAIAARV